MVRWKNWTAFIIGSILLIPMSTLLSQSVRAATSTVSVVPSSLMVEVEQNFNVDITVSDVLNLYAWEFTLAWDPSLLDAVNVNEGPFLKGNGRPTFFTYNISALDGRMVVDCTLLGWIPGVSGSGILSTLTFHAKTYGETPLEMYNVSLIDSYEQLIPSLTLNGYVRIISPHDVAVTSVHVSPLLAPIGDPVNVDVSIRNQGNYDEIAQVSVYVNSTVVGTQPIYVNSGSSTYVSFMWDTTAYAKGDYLILATVDPVPGELDLADNTQDAENLATLLTPGHDVTVVAVKPAKTVLGQGFNLTVTVKVGNYGIFSETFNVTVYSNTTALGSQIVSLSSGSKADVVFANTSSSISMGIYTISASAYSFSGETETGDNTLSDGLIVITIPGDIQGDFIVDIYDAIQLSNIYGTNSGMDAWNPNVDINSDTSIDIFDAIILSNNFGQRYP